MVFYFVTKELVPGSLLQRFVDGDDEFRTSRLKLIPSVKKVLISVSLYIKKINAHIISNANLLLKGVKRVAGGNV